MMFRSRPPRRRPPRRVAASARWTCSPAPSPSPSWGDIGVLPPLSTTRSTLSKHSNGALRGDGDQARPRGDRRLPPHRADRGRRRDLSPSSGLKFSGGSNASRRSGGLRAGQLRIMLDVQWGRLLPLRWGYPNVGRRRRATSTATRRCATTTRRGAFKLNVERRTAAPAQHLRLHPARGPPRRALCRRAAWTARRRAFFECGGAAGQGRDMIGAGRGGAVRWRSHRCPAHVRPEHRESAPPPYSLPGEFLPGPSRSQPPMAGRKSQAATPFAL